MVESGRTNLLKTFMLNNMLSYFKITIKYLNDMKSTMIHKKKEFNAIIPDIVPYIGAIGCYNDYYGGITQLIYKITLIFPSLFKRTYMETGQVSKQRQNLADPHGSSDDD
eukprot:242815_1